MSHSKLWNIAVAAATLAAVAGGSAAAASSSHATLRAPARQAPHGVFTMDFPGDFPTLDPVTWQDQQSEIVMNAIYDTLVTYSVSPAHPAQIVAGLASHWNASKNGLTYTFTLRKGARFSNNDPVTAQDVVYSLNRVTSYNAGGPSGPAPYGSAYSDIVGYNAWFNGGKKPAASVKGMAGLSAPNASTVVIHLVQPQAYFLNELALQAAAIVDPKVVQKWGVANYELHAVGSGPYELENWTRNKDMVLVPNPYYSGPTPAKVAKMVFNVNIQTGTELLLFKQGKDDMIFQLDSPTFLATVMNPSLHKDYFRNSTNAIWYFSLNTTKPPFNNPLVRKAVNLAINRNYILRLVNGRGSIMSQVLPPAMPGYERSFKGYAYNPTEAKKLLAQAGYKHGLTVTLVYTSGRSFTQEISQNIQAQLAKVGITVNFHNIPQTGPFFSYVGQASNPFNIAWGDWWQDYPDPQDFLFDLLDSQTIGSLNTAAWKNTQFDKLVNRADILPRSEQQLRLKLYDEAQAIWFKDAPWMPIYFPIIDCLVQPSVQSRSLTVLLHPVIGPDLRYISVK